MPVVAREVVRFCLGLAIYLVVTICISVLGEVARAEDEIQEAQGLSKDDDEIGEVQGLSDEASQPSSTSDRTGSGAIKKAWKTRSYLFLEQTWQKTIRPLRKLDRNTYGEASFIGDWHATDELQVFLDGRGYNDVSGHFLVMEQGGVRYRPTDSVLLVCGKERNRTSPGLLVSPSDFINSNENLPGMREQRRGVWLTRVALQTHEQAFDLILLPSDHTNVQGFPDKKSKWNGLAVRGYKRHGESEVTVLAGTMRDKLKIGLSIQTIVEKNWKTYLESGYLEEELLFNFKRKKVLSHLLGASYEGWQSTSLRGEVFFNGAGMNEFEYKAYQTFLPMISANAPAEATEATGFAFLRKLYAIANFTRSDILNQFAWIESLIKSLEDKSAIVVSRIEWAAQDHITAGISHIRIIDEKNGQYALRPIDTRVSADVKYTF